MCTLVVVKSESTERRHDGRKVPDGISRIILALRRRCPYFYCSLLTVNYTFKLRPLKSRSFMGDLPLVRVPLRP